MEITKKDLDALKELCNIGSGNAISALSDFIGKKVDIYIPKVKLMTFQKIPELLGEEDSIIAGVLQEIKQGLSAFTMFALHEDSYKTIIKTMMHQIGHYDYNVDMMSSSEIEKSIIKEITNILTGSYLNAISTLLNKKLNISAPILSIDMSGALLTQILYFFTEVPEEVLIIETELFLDNKKINGTMLLFPELESLYSIIKSLRMERAYG